VFCWDEGNQPKIEERFDIEEVEEVFDDEHRIPAPAYRGAYHGLRDLAERRHAIIGMSVTNRLLFVIYTWRGDQIRVISARFAGPKEQRLYWNKRSKS
jgi:uncharacterized DUF497 family protein